MKFIVLLSCLIYVAQIQASSSSDIRSKPTGSISSHSVRHTSEMFPTNDTYIIEDDFLNRTGDKISDEPNQVIIHKITSLRTRNIKVRTKNRNTEDDTEPDHIGQSKLKKTCTLEQVPSQIPSVIKMKSFPISIKNHNSNLLQDENNIVRNILPEDISVMEQDFSQEHLVPQVNKEFEELISQGKYKEIFELGIRMKMKCGEFLKQLCPVVKTLEQYKGIVDHLRRHNMVAPFYVYGDIRVVQEAVVESGVYDIDDYKEHGGLEMALHLAFNEDCHVRVINILEIRQEMTAQKDEQLEKNGEMTSFGYFVHWLLSYLAPVKDGMTLKRFLTLCGDELGSKNPDILDTLCKELVDHLNLRLSKPEAEKLLTDLTGQPSLLTLVSFTKGFLKYGGDENLSVFIKYGWREAIQEGLKKEYPHGGKKLWRVMQTEQPDQFPGEFPDTEDARAAVCMHFPMKQQKEEEWGEKNAKILFNKLRHHEYISYLFPDVLWFTIASYAISWTDTDDSTIPSK